MKTLPILTAALCLAALGACSIKEERTVQQPAPATSTVVATPAPASGTVVYSPQPAPTTTTVYTR